MLECKLKNNLELESILRRLGIYLRPNYRTSEFLGIEYDFDFGWFVFELDKDRFYKSKLPIVDNKYLRCQIVKTWLNHDSELGAFDYRRHQYYLNPLKV